VATRKEAWQSVQVKNSSSRLVDAVRRWVQVLTLVEVVAFQAFLSAVLGTKELLLSLLAAAEVLDLRMLAVAAAARSVNVEAAIPRDPGVAVAPTVDTVVRRVPLEDAPVDTLGVVKCV